METGEMNAVFDQTNFDFGFLDDDTLGWLEEQTTAGLIGEWVDGTVQY